MEKNMYTYYLVCVLSGAESDKVISISDKNGWQVEINSMVFSSNY